ncbi:MAG: Gfo/Idh/MocA family oxidoreductase [Bryobacteraceae bacterium]|nr:Gfo/Idh/MocA family oxidoreductase [Bryobacteraceae bacterium]
MSGGKITRRVALLAPLPALAAPGSLNLPKKVRVVLIGKEGHTGEVTTPAKQIPGIEIVAQLDSQTDYRPVLDREKPDLVAICNDNGQRAAAILACAERKLAFIAEKPFAITLDDLARCRKAVEKSGVRYTMMLPLRFTPHFLALKQLVASGQIGEVAQIGGQKSYKPAPNVAWRNKASSYGGTIPWVGIHMADLMRWTSGREFVAAAAFQTRLGWPALGDRENAAAALFHLDNGGAGTLRMDYLRPDGAITHEDDRLRLAGTKGVAEYQASTGVTLLTYDAPPRVIPPLAPQSLFVEFLRALYLGGPDPISASDIWRINEICLKTRDAANSGRVVKLT